MTLEEYLKALEEKRKSVHAKLQAGAIKLGEEHNYVTSTLKKEDADYDERMKALTDAMESQKALREELTNLEETMENLAVAELDEEKFKKSGEKKIKSGMGEPVFVNPNAGPQRDISKLGDDIAEYMERRKLNNHAALKSMGSHFAPERLKDGGSFQPCLEFHVGFGTDSGILDDPELGSKIKPEIDEYRKRKSMFSQHPLAGGQTVLGQGTQYDPEGSFAGNTGGIFEYTIDKTLYNIPYAPQGIMQVLSVQAITGNSHHFVRQTIRVNNAKALLDSITTPPVNFVQEKPRNEYGWTLVKTYIMTYASTVILSDEFEEDAKPIADAVRDQLGTDVMRTFANSLANGANTLANPDITGLFNLAGVNTRIHRGASAFGAPLSGTPSASTATDDERETIERAVLDLQRWGFSPDYALVPWAIVDRMRFIRNVGTEERRYNEAELSSVSGARIVSGVEVPASQAMVGDFSASVRALLRMGMTIQVGYVNNQFVTDQFTIRARVRGGLKAMRPYGLERITYP